MKLGLVHELVVGGGGFRIGAGACAWVLVVAEIEFGWSMDLNWVVVAFESVLEYAHGYW